MYFHGLGYKSLALKGSQEQEKHSEKKRTRKFSAIICMPELKC